MIQLISLHSNTLWWSLSVYTVQANYPLLLLQVRLNSVFAEAGEQSVLWRKISRRVVPVCCTISLGDKVLYLSVGLLWEHVFKCFACNLMFWTLCSLALKECLESGRVADKHNTRIVLVMPICHCWQNTSLVQLVWIKNLQPQISLG